MKRYRIRKKRGFLILALIALILVAGCFFIFSKLFADKGYSDQNSFEKYAKQYAKSIDGKKKIGTEESSVKFGTPLSTAVSYPSLEQKTATSSLKSHVDSRVKDFESTYGNLPAEDQAALMIDYESYKTPHDVVGVSIHEKQVKDPSKKGAETTVDTVKTFNLSTKSGVTIPAGRILKGDWQKFVKEKLSSEIKNSSDLDKVDLSNFVMTDDGFKFYIAPGLADKKEAGVKSLELSYSEMKDYTQKDIGSRIVDPNKPMVALTYDDGPGDRTTDELLDLYEREGVVCTFFELGKNVEGIKGGADMLKREIELGCEVGTHSWDHPNLFTLSDAQVKEQATRSIAAIKKATGQNPTTFRAPYGNGNNKISKIFGLPGINWTVDTLDWKTKNKDAIINQVKKFPNLDGQVVLMHSIYHPTVEASKVLVPWLKEKGYQLVTVSELLEYKYKETPKQIYYGYTFTNLNQNQKSKSNGNGQ